MAIKFISEFVLNYVILIKYSLGVRNKKKRVLSIAMILHQNVIGSWNLKNLETLKCSNERKDRKHFRHTYTRLKNTKQHVHRVSDSFSCSPVFVSLSSQPCQTTSKHDICAKRRKWNMIGKFVGMSVLICVNWIFFFVCLPFICSALRQYKC